MRNTHTLKWFTERVGKFIYRRKIYDFEDSTKPIRIKVSNPNHAELLHELQQRKNITYYENEAQLQEGKKGN